MFGPPGHLYVYFTYGMHWCANVVSGPACSGYAVLLRAGLPLGGIEAMRAARPAARRDRDLASGPARLCQALGIVGRHDGVDLVDPQPGAPWLGDDGTAPPAEPAVSTRIGLTKGAEHRWRWYVAGDPNVSH
jgi:DNA-3-methyladenine glycosylase